MVYCAGYCDPNTRDVARLRKAKKHSPRVAARVFPRFLKVSRHPACFGSQYTARFCIPLIIYRVMLYNILIRY